jgi:hypothetical protein
MAGCVFRDSNVSCSQMDLSLSLSLSHLGRTKNAGQTSCIGFSSLTRADAHLAYPAREIERNTRMRTRQTR